MLPTISLRICDTCDPCSLNDSACKTVQAGSFTCAVASLANIGAVAAAPIIARSLQRDACPVGVLMALMGYVLGTFGGLTVAKLLSMIAGA